MTRRLAYRLLGVAGAAGVVALLMWMSFQAGRESARAMPRVGFVETEVPLGVYDWGSTAKAELHFENRTAAAVTLGGFSSSMGGTVVGGRERFVRRVIAPGEVITVPVELTIGTTSPERLVTIVATLMDRRRFTASLRAQVKYGWFLSAQSLDIGKVTLGAADPVVGEFSFRSANDRLRDVDTGAAWFSAEVFDAGPTEQTVRVRADPGQVQPGKNYATIRFKTTNNVVPNGAIDVTALGVAGLFSRPRKVQIEPGGSATVRFTDSGGAPIELVAAKSSSMIQAQLTGGGTVQIVVSKDAAFPNGSGVRVRDRLGREGVVEVATIHLPTPQTRPSPGG